MNDLNDTRRLRPPQKPVFVDWRGSRRRIVIAVGTAVGVFLAGWLGLIIGSVMLAMA
ncbi:hypothetical protein JIG36_05515 [Actinoplanes sp. LDG1-06]|uniref:Uncharacterized protein n=1 Tax=Paractinoplanes ovalisporus TaxID=2810368 RepID=A0ABS2A5A2_9ACTN|nr:hypothetical protein [Actinoplanes ovalisporus]MBM2615016.1 hypothetical protein [Actinoplanes ovalisporus]